MINSYVWIFLNESGHWIPLFFRKPKKQNRQLHIYWLNAEVPVVYAYATTMRRAQGSTLDLVGLKFDRRRPDRGYAYVGTSRARKHTDVFHLGRIRRSDWLPVGVDSRGNEQRSPGPQSFSDSCEDSDPPTEDEETENEPSQIADDCFDTDVEDYTAWNRFRPRVWEEPGPGQQPTKSAED